MIAPCPVCNSIVAPEKHSIIFKIRCSVCGYEWGFSQDRKETIHIWNENARFLSEMKGIESDLDGLIEFRSRFDVQVDTTQALHSQWAARLNLAMGGMKDVEGMMKIPGNHRDSEWMKTFDKRITSISHNIGSILNDSKSLCYGGCLNEN